MDFSLTSEVSYSNLYYVIGSAGRNPNAKELVVDWLIENWAVLVKNGGGGSDMLLRHILKMIIPVSGVGREEN